jgi:serine/threonine-protein kinase
MEIRFISSKHVRMAADAELPLPVARAPDLSGRVLGARYSLRRRIGGGNMGTVYEARDMTLGTAVAVKVLHPDYAGDADFRRRFHQEALLGARLRHEHSVAVTDLGETDDGLFYSVMEYLEGESLDGLLSSRRGPLPWRRVVTIAVQVCAALQAAHERGVIHRDIKPGNCFLIRREGRGAREDDDPDFTYVKVLDLGLARLMPAGGRPTPPGRLGAPEYLAPEQVQGFTCDHRVDLYAVGVMMYKLLTRRLPFTGDSPAAIMKMHIEAAPAPLRRVAPGADIPAGLEAVVLRALAKSPADRYPDARSLADAVRAAAAEAEAEAVAIDESLEEAPILGRRSPLHTRALHSAPLPISVRSTRSQLGLLGLLLALASILAVALSTLVGQERALPAAASYPAAPLGPAAPPGPAAPLVAAPPTLVAEAPLTAFVDSPTDPSATPSRALADPPVDPPATLASITESLVHPPGPVTAGARGRLSERSARPDLVDAPRTAGAPPERMFQRLADTVAPGVYRCMQRHAPGKDVLTVELTVGGPRRSAVALGLREHDSLDLRRCLAPLLARLSFPATEQTARYAHVYRP